MYNIEAIKAYLMNSQKMCLEETGHTMSLVDIQGHILSDEFQEKFGIIDLATIINILIQQ